LAAAVCLWQDVRIAAGEIGWYSAPVRFADWRGVGPVDLATNPLVSRYYNGGDPIAFRRDRFETIDRRLAGGDTLLVGLDYYALQGVVGDLVPEEILRREHVDLLAGGVCVYRVVLRGGDLTWDRVGEASEGAKP
jgi:hypothetical protein